jgi:hypothetical protein
MKKSEIREAIKGYVEICQQVHIDRSRIDLNALHGYPLVLGQKLLLVQYLDDFQFDGYMIVRIKDITSVISGDSERFSEFILKEEGIFNEIKNPQITNCDTWEIVINELKAIGKNIIIECEDIDEGKFYIGKIIEVTKNAVSFLYFDGVGKWDDASTIIYFKDITSIKFEDRYTTIISKYVK